MTCPKCQNSNVEPALRWTLSGRKMTLPQLRVWDCLNFECRHQWPREITSPIVAPAPLTCPDRLTQEVSYEQR
jgi:hypothetical protein